VLSDGMADLFNYGNPDRDIEQVLRQSYLFVSFSVYFCHIFFSAYGQQKTSFGLEMENPIYIILKKSERGQILLMPDCYFEVFITSLMLMLNPSKFASHE
jgi:hypothetical protein